MLFIKQEKLQKYKQLFRRKADGLKRCFTVADFWMMLAVKSCLALATLPVTSLVEGQVFGPPLATCPLHIKYGCPLNSLCYTNAMFFR